jgi:hypothetical protein
MRPLEAPGLNERETLAGRHLLRHGVPVLLLLASLGTARIGWAQDAGGAPGTAPATPDPTSAAPALQPTAPPPAPDAAAAQPPQSPTDAAAPAQAAQPPATAAPQANPTAPPAPIDGAARTAEADRDTEERAARELARARRSGEVVQLEVDGEQVLALWRPSEAGERRGGVVLLHAVPGSLDEPAVTGPLRRGLPASGFATLSVALPVPAQGAAAIGSAPWQEPVRLRLAAAFAWMVANDGPVHALVAHGSSAAHVKRLVEAATGRPEGLEAVVLIDAGPGLAAGETLWTRALPLPVLDLVPERATESVRLLANQRRNSARRAGGAEYRLVAMAGVAERWFPARDRLLAAVRGFLLRHVTSAGNTED